MRSFFLPFILIITSTHLLARFGSISGQVLDSETKQYLEGASVIIEALNLGTSCDRNGNFYIDNVPTGSYNIFITRIGYEKVFKVNVTVNANRQTPIKVHMNPIHLKQREIITRAGFFEKSADAIISSQSIDRSEIRSDPIGAYDIQMMVHSLPSVITATDQNNEIIVRGGGPSENLFIIDNIEIPNPNHFGEVGSGGGPVNIINTEFVEKIDFFAGGFSSKYGDKQSSVMDISLREGNFKNFELDIEMSMAGVGILAEGPLTKNISFISSYRKSFIKDLIKSAGLISVPEYANTQHKLTYNINSNNKLIFNFIGAIDNIEIQDENRPDLKGAENVSYSGFQYTGGVTLKSLFSKNGYLLFSTGKTLSSWNADVYKNNLTAIDTFFYRKNIESDKFLKFDLTYKISKNIKYSLGFNIKQGSYKMNESLDPDTLYLYSYPDLDPDIDLSQFPSYYHFEKMYPEYTSFLDNNIIRSVIGTTPRFINNQKGYLWKYSGFSQIKFQVDVLELTCGARYDRVPFNNTSVFSPRIGLNIPLNRLAKLNIAAGRFYQTPSYWIFLNPNNPRPIKHSYSDHFILGLEYYIDDDIKMTIEAYNKKIFNRPVKISDITVDPNDMILGFNDSGSGKSYGAEFFLQKKYSDRWYGTISYSYSKSDAKDYRQNKNGSYPWDFDVRNSLTIVGGYKINFNNFDWYKKYKQNILFNFISFFPFSPSDQFEISFRSKYSDGLPVTPKTYNFEQRRWYVDDSTYLNSERRDYYYRFDLMVLRRFNFKHFNLTTFIDIQNIFNRNNEWEKVYLDNGKYQMSYQYKQIPVAGLIIEI